MVKRYFNNPVFLSFIICVFLFNSSVFRIFHKEEICPLTLCPLNSVEYFSGTILSSPCKTSDGKYYKCTLNLNNVKAKNNCFYSCKGKCSLYIPSEITEAFFPGKLYSASKNRGSFIYESGGEYLFKGYYSSKGFTVEKTIFCLWKSNIHGKINYLRALCRLQFKRLMYSWNNAGGLLLALLCGERSYTSSDISDSFRNAGLSHILALSGMHLSLFSGIAMLIGEKSKRRKVSFVIRIFFLIVFVWFAGFSPSLLRAFIFSILLIAGNAANVPELDNILVLCFTFLLQTVISPEDVNNIGFVLSYTALFGIMIAGIKIKKILSKILPDYFSSSLSSSCGAQIFTTPACIKNFGYLCPGGVISTMIVSPMVTFFIYSGMIFILLSLIIPDLSGPSGIFLNFEYTIIKIVVAFFAKIPKWSFS